MFMCHLLVNVGMNMSIMPITGIPLPFISYGGSFTLTTLAQLPMAHDYANSGADTTVVGGISNADDFENLRVRLKVGFYF